MPYIITCDNTIWATGDTPEAAWIDFHAEMAAANVRVIDRFLFDDTCAADFDPPVAVISDYTCERATDALVTLVGFSGGDIAWGYRAGVACTCDEEASS